MVCSWDEATHVTVVKWWYRKRSSDPVEIWKFEDKNVADYDYFEDLLLVEDGVKTNHAIKLLDVEEEDVGKYFCSVNIKPDKTLYSVEKKLDVIGKMSVLYICQYVIF